MSSLTAEGAASSRGAGPSGAGGGAPEAEDGVQVSPVRSPVPLISITAPDRGHRMAEDSEDEGDDDDAGELDKTDVHLLFV